MSLVNSDKYVCILHLCTLGDYYRYVVSPLHNLTTKNARLPNRRGVRLRSVSNQVNGIQKSIDEKSVQKCPVMLKY